MLLTEPLLQDAFVLRPSYFALILIPVADDFYKTLGVKRDASQADIQKAYRDLARKYHPDLNPNDKTAKEKFQKLQAAFEVLNDPSKRELYDRYGSSFESFAQGGGPRPQGRGAWQAGPAADTPDVDFSEFFGERYGADPSAAFGDMFGQFRRAGGGRRAKKGRAPTGADIESQIEIPFQTAVTGGKVDLTLQRPSGHTETISVKIPPGVDEGKKIRLRGQGEAIEGAAPGDLLLTIHVAPHPFFHRRGKDLEVRLPVTLAEAVLGAKVDVPTPSGTISLRIPPHTSSGKKLRIKGHGVKTADGPPGDLFAEVLIVLPERIDEPALEAIKRLDADQQQSPRADLRW
jgi:curved DNA-binding protein